ncbi:MAG: hypothetical protein SGI71_08640 [Verrucomicrobiota bacterium]|nr:hypothetical protein [Verrucomicrobiota bacterium]
MSSVKVNGNPARGNAANDVDGEVDVVQGSNTIEIVTRDYHEQSVTNRYPVALPQGSGKAYQYDDNGNLVTHGHKSYALVGVNRLKKTTYGPAATPDNTTEYNYDGAGQRVKIVEKDATSTVTSDKKFVWCGGAHPCEERDATGTVIKRFYGYRFYNPQTGRWINRDPMSEPGHEALYSLVPFETVPSWQESFESHLPQVQISSAGEMLLLDGNPYLGMRNNHLFYIDPDGRNPAAAVGAAALVAARKLLLELLKNRGKKIAERKTKGQANS